MPTSLDGLPDFPLDQSRPLTSLLNGASTFHEAARVTEQLLYGRNSRPLDYSLVPVERRGSCTTKHAYLVALGREHDCPLRLLLCFFEMSGRTHPAVAETLARSGLESILEAHCMLGLAGGKFDLTGVAPGDHIPRYSDPVELPLERLGQKQTLHRAALERWALQQGLAMSIDELWAIRERCIQDLSTAEIGRARS